jgi:uncharacterized protein with PQ loop repeat
MFTNILGIIGALLLSLCAIPQAIQVFKTQNTKSLSLLFLLLWTSGEIFMWIYVILQNITTYTFQWPLHINYLFNILILIYLLIKKITLDLKKGINK